MRDRRPVSRWRDAPLAVSQPKGQAFALLDDGRNHAIAKNSDDDPRKKKAPSAYFIAKCLILLLDFGGP